MTWTRVFMFLHLRTLFFVSGSYCPPQFSFSFQNFASWIKFLFLLFAFPSVRILLVWNNSYHEGRGSCEKLEAGPILACGAVRQHCFCFLFIHRFACQMTPRYELNYKGHMLWHLIIMFLQGLFYTSVGSRVTSCFLLSIN